MFNDLPEGCVAHIVQQLHSVQDVLNLQRTCVKLWAISKADQTVWLGLLEQDFDIRVQVQPSLVSLHIARNGVSDQLL